MKNKKRQSHISSKKIIFFHKRDILKSNESSELNRFHWKRVVLNSKTWTRYTDEMTEIVIIQLKIYSLSNHNASELTGLETHIIFF